MKFEYKSVSEVAALTPEQAQYYSEQKRAFETNATKEMIADAIKAAFPAKTADQIKAETDAIEAEKTEKEKLKTDVEAIKETVNQLKERTIGGQETKVKLADEVKANKDKLKSSMKTFESEVELKADTNRASISDNPYRVMLPGIGQLLRVARALYDVFRKVNLPCGSHNGKISYVDWDEATSVKAAATVAEGGTFPESTAKFKTYDVSLKKIGDSLPVTEEFFEDEVFAAAELERFIEANVDSVIDTQIATGDGTGDNITGAMTSAGEFTAAASGITDANIYDLIVKVKGNITSTGGNKYRPDFAAMNNTTLNRLLLKKDANNNYIFPAGHPIYREIVEDNSLADNTMLVGDSRYGTIYEMGGVVVSRGMINAQFTTDKVTLKARKRLLLLIRNSDKSGFKKVSDVDAALATIAA